MVHLQNRNLQEALQSFEEAIKLNDQNSKAWQYKDLGQILNEKYSQTLYMKNSNIRWQSIVLKWLQKLIQHMFKRLIVKVIHSSNQVKSKQVIQSLNQFEEAVRCFNVALTINPKLAILHYNKGLSYHNLNLFNDAIQSYNEAINIDQNFVLAYNNKGMSLLLN